MTGFQFQLVKLTSTGFKLWRSWELQAGSLKVLVCWLSIRFMLDVDGSWKHIDG